MSRLHSYSLIKAIHIYCASHNGKHFIKPLKPLGHVVTELLWVFYGKYHAQTYLYPEIRWRDKDNSAAVVYIIRWALCHMCTKSFNNVNTNILIKQLLSVVPNTELPIYRHYRAGLGDVWCNQNTSWNSADFCFGELRFRISRIAQNLY